MKTTLPLALGLFTALLSPLHAEQELTAPDVSFYLDAQATRANYDAYGLNTSDGLAVKGGMWLNSVDTGGQSRLGLDIGLLRLGKDTRYTQFTRAPTVSDGTNTDSVVVKQRDALELNGMTLGTTWDTGHLVYLRAGAFLYNYKATQDQQRLLINNTTNTTQTVNDTPQSDSRSGVAPYVTFGLAIPLGDHLAINADYNQYLLESQRFGSFGLGIRYTD